MFFATSQGNTVFNNAVGGGLIGRDTSVLSPDAAKNRDDGECGGLGDGIDGSRCGGTQG